MEKEKRLSGKSVKNNIVMKPILYRFSINGHTVRPTYKDDLSKEYELESSQQFFRAKLSGNLSFIKDDFYWLKSQPFETEFILLLEESFDAGKTWKEYFKGRFFKTDCKWDEDNKKCEVQPETYDQYNDVLAGLDKEFNLIDLAPEIRKLTIKKRPLIQIYVAGDEVVSNVIGGVYWEQDVTEATTDENKLVRDYYFAKASVRNRIQIKTDGTGILKGLEGDYVGDAKGVMKQVDGFGILTYFEYTETISSSSGGGKIYYNGYTLELKYSVLGKYKFQQRKVYTTPQGSFLDIPTTFSLEPESGLGANCQATKNDVNIYMRYLTDSERISGKDTYLLPEVDIVANNRNYKRAIGFNFDLFYTSQRTQEEPTKWGRAANGEYFIQPGADYFPIARRTWNVASYWFRNDRVYTKLFEDEGTKEYILNDAYTVSSCINVLLQNIASGIKHEATTDYSEFLYSNYNPISFQNFRLLVTPKSNILAGEYQTPALKAVTTLREFLNMLRDCYRCYWYIEDGKFKIEHINYFKNGGTYSSIPAIGTDLTKLINPKNKKSWGFNTNNYEYDKSDMPERYQFSWMDEVTEAFEGLPIAIKSKFVTAGKIEEITISKFTSDVDYMLLNPSAISQDGFALFSAVLSGDNYELPIIERYIGGNALRIQNGYASWITLQPNYYIYDLPASRAVINGQETTVKTSRNKKQKLIFPTAQDIETNKLIKTFIGNGQIEKISVNLSSRINEVTLKYDTEQ